MSLPATQKASLVREVSSTPAGIEYADIETPQITGPHDVIIKNKYGGVNFIDVYFRQGFLPVPFPHVFGREASGVVAAIGDEVTKYKVGDKVAYLCPETFAQYTKIADSVVMARKLPENSTDEEMKQWAAILLQGLTAVTLTNDAYKVKKDDYILVWAAAGGVGQLITKYGSSLGAKVIAIASSDEKLQIAKNAGAEFLIRTDEDVPARVNEITSDQGVHAVYDSVGKDSFEASLASLRLNGMLATFGNSSGPVLPFGMNRLIGKNLKVSSSSVFASVGTQENWDRYTSILQDALDRKLIDAPIHKTYPLSEYAQATEDLEGRKTTGKLIVQIP